MFISFIVFLVFSLSFFSFWSLSMLFCHSFEGACPWTWWYFEVNLFLTYSRNYISRYSWKGATATNFADRIPAKKNIKNLRKNLTEKLNTYVQKMSKRVLTMAQVPPTLQTELVPRKGLLNQKYLTCCSNCQINQWQILGLANYEIFYIQFYYY